MGNIEHSNVGQACMEICVFAALTILLLHSTLDSQSYISEDLIFENLQIFYSAKEQNFFICVNYNAILQE